MAEHIQVFVRCRPLLKTESNPSSPVEVHPELNRIMVRDTRADKCTVKSFTFDKVFGPEATQADIYKEIVAPVVQEVIEGFKCTIFAYGQTGTGKTFTIEGDRSKNFSSESDDHLSGIIPRSMNHLFNELREENKYEICVSFLELYNEEIFDLLSKFSDPVKLKMYNSSEKGSVVVQGLQIVPVKSMEDVYNILDTGCKKRRKAATLLNQNSSRSHTIFTVTVSIEESSSTLEKVKFGKLNLVDLAGSENIGRSGAIDKRAKEAGNINQSLLALGRVITSLCEKAGHIPYRESKLTRLLRDSLGGQTKTAIIATISPSGAHTDETLNTLEYALRAKSITNKPEINAQVAVNTLMQDYLEKIYQVKREMHKMGHSKGCLYAEDENFATLKSTIDSKRDEQLRMLKQIEELKEQEKALDDAILEANKEATAKQSLLDEKKKRNLELRAKLAKAKKQRKLKTAELEAMQPIHEKLHNECHVPREELKILQTELNKRKEALKYAANEQKNMNAKIQRVRSKRKQWNETFRHNSEKLLSNVKDIQENVNTLTAESDNHISQLQKDFEERRMFYEKEFENLLQAISDLKAVPSSFQEKMNTFLQEEKADILKAIEDFQNAYIACLEKSLFEPLDKAQDNCLSSLQNISSSLNAWKIDLTSEADARQNRLKEHVDNQKRTLELTIENSKVLLNKQKETAEAFKSVISECLSLERANKNVMNEKFMAVEQALSALDSHYAQCFDSEVEKANEAISTLKNYSVFGSEITGKLTNFCQNSVNNIDGLKEEVIKAHSFSSEKFEDLKRNANLACSNYKDLNSEMAKIHNTLQTFRGNGSDVECILKNKLKTHDQSKVSNQIEMLSDSILKGGDRVKSLLRESRDEVEILLPNEKEHMKEITELSNRISDIANSKTSDSIRCLKENLVKSVTNQDFEMTTTEDKETSLEISVLDMENTVISSDTNGPAEFQPENECPICINRTADDTLKADYIVTSKYSLTSPVKPPQAKTETSGSKSLSFPKSPIRRPLGKIAFQARKNLNNLDIGKLTEETLLENLDDEC